LGIGQVRLSAAVDDQQNSMLPAGQPEGDVEMMMGRRYYRYGGSRSFAQEISVNLAWPSKSAKSVKLLRGTAPVTLLAKQEPLLTVEDVLKSKGKKLQAGNTDLHVEDVKEVNEGGNRKVYHIKLLLRENRKDNVQDYTWVNSLYQRIEVLDEKGNKFTSRGMNWNSSSPTSVQGTFMFGDPFNGQAIGKPAKLVYYGWQTMDYEVTFEFKDLPLP
jgi:hypothetical protein